MLIAVCWGSLMYVVLILFHYLQKRVVMQILSLSPYCGSHAPKERREEEEEHRRLVD